MIKDFQSDIFVHLEHLVSHLDGNSGIYTSRQEAIQGNYMAFYCT